jgi:uncharacterized protein
MDTFFQNKYNRQIVGLALLMVVIALGMYARLAWKQAEYLYQGPTTISVSGEGEVNAVPDIGQFSYSVTMMGADAVEARSKAAEITVAIANYLKSVGVEERDIKTEFYNLNPKYRWENRPCPMGSFCPGESVQDGFEVTETVQVKIRNLAQAGELISGVSGLGATSVSGLSFTIDDEKSLKDEARALAITEAQAKAQVLAQQLGVRLVKFSGYYEDEGMYPAYGYGGDMAMERMALPTAAVTPEPQLGDRTVRSRVTVTYQVK